MKLSRTPEYIAALRTMTLLRLDAALWSRQVSALRSARNNDAAVSTALFCDLFTMPAAAKMQSLYGAALREWCISPTVLMQAPNPAIERIYNAFEGTKFVYLNNFIDDAMRELAAHEANTVVEKIKRAQELQFYVRNQVRNGRNVLSRVLRLFRQGHLDVGRAEHREALCKWLTESIVTSDAAQKVIAAVRPKMAIFLERGYTPAGEVFDSCLAMGVDTIQWLGAPQADQLIFKRYNMPNHDQHPLALSDTTWRFLKETPWTQGDDDNVIEYLTRNYEAGSWFNRQELQAGKKIQSREEIVASLKLDGLKKTAVIFCHILYDATFFYGDSLFSDYERWLIEAVRGAIANDNLNWVVKVHPVNVWRSKMDSVAMEQLEVAAIRREFGDLPAHVRILPADTDINTYSLFSFIDYGLTVRGTIGLELPCFGIPVVTAGSGRYSGRGFTIDPRSPEEFADVLANLHERPRLDPLAARAARQYAYGTFSLRPTPMKSFLFDYDAKTFGLPELSANVLPVGGRAFGPELGCDISQLGAWMANSSLEDFIFERKS